MLKNVTVQVSASKIRLGSSMSGQADVKMKLGVSESQASKEPRLKYFDQSPEDCEDYKTHENKEADQLDEISEGYISTKDYAYDRSNPLHYGYLQGEEGDYYGEEDMMGDDGEDVDGDQDKRQSIILPKDYLINQLAVALYDFEPENDNELGLNEGDVVFISYRHGQGWLVAENQERTKTGLVPEDFVTYLDDNKDDEEGTETARPFYLTHFITQGINSAVGIQTQEDVGGNDGDHEDDGEWEDVDHLEEEIADKLKIRN